MIVEHDAPVVIAGMGPVGCGITRLLAAAGTPPVALIDPSPSETAHAFGISLHASITHTLVPTRGVLVLAVPDRVLDQVVAQCAPLLGETDDLLIVHTSGARGAAVLAPLRRRTVHVAMFHPAQSFPHSELPLERLRGVTCGIEAEASLLPRLDALAARLSWHPVHLHADRIPLYHAACVLTGNVLPAIMLAAEQMLASSLASSGDAQPRHAFDPMTASVLAELMQHDAAASITGPTRRAELDTIAAHMDAIRESHPELLDFYTAASALIARFAPLDDARRDALLRLLASR